MKLAIHPDTDYESPRDWDNLFKMAFYHKRYLLGDKKDYKDHNDLDKELKTGKYLFYPVYMYDHGGITISLNRFNCTFDSGLLGYIYVEKEKIRNEFGWKKITKKRLEKIQKIAESEVKIYDHYLTGEVFCYQILDDENNEIDSCSGFFGSKIQDNGILENIDKNLHDKLFKKGYCVYDYFYKDNKALIQ